MDVNKPITPDGWPPLLLSVTYGRLDFVKELIKQGADVNISKGQVKSPFLVYFGFEIYFFYRWVHVLDESL